uniref:Uncharacterized protein n=2 Tax=Octopus bimaculoides TaxID=37653 RepID=A0A0L8G2G9_OCTBM
MHSSDVSYTPDAQGPTDIIKPKVLQMTSSFSITVSQYRSSNGEAFFSLHFNILSKFVPAGGILSNYATEFQCIERPPNHMVLSNRAGLYYKTSYKTESASVSHCVMM